VREPNDLNTVVHRAVLLVKHKLEMQNIAFEEKLGEHLPPVMCDANQIQQVVLVLLVNASEAMAKGGQLEVRTGFNSQTEQDMVWVKDNGSGITPEVMARIFDPFFTTKEDQNRTGLGLAVAHSIVEQHGGEITVRSEPGQGPEFQVGLPMAAVGVGA
jgi:two-component system NtrC family sensor kinase